MSSVDHVTNCDAGHPPLLNREVGDRAARLPGADIAMVVAELDQAFRAGTFAATALRVEPTPIPLVVRSLGEIVLICVTRGPAKNVTVKVG